MTEIMQRGDRLSSHVYNDGFYNLFTNTKYYFNPNPSLSQS